MKDLFKTRPCSPDKTPEVPESNKSKHFPGMSMGGAPSSALETGLRDKSSKGFGDLHGAFDNKPAGGSKLK